MRKGAFFSAALHIAIILIAIFGLPRLSQPPVIADQTIMVDVITIAPKTNLPPPAPKPEPPKEVAQVQTPPPAPEPPKPEPPKPLPPPPKAEAPPPAPPPPQQAKAEPPKPEPPKPEPPPPPPKAEAPKPVPKEEPRPVAPPPPPPQQAKVEPPKPVVKPPPPKPPEPQQAKQQPKQPSAFDQLLKDLTKRQPTPPQEQAEQKPKVPPPPQPPSPQQQTASRTPASDMNQQLTLSELDAIRSQIAQCWNMPVGARDAQNLVVDLHVDMNPDGTVRNAVIVDQSRMYSDPFYRAAAESALRAMLNPKCSPLRLPVDKFETWKTFTISFNPKDMLS